VDRQQLAEQLRTLIGGQTSNELSASLTPLAREAQRERVAQDFHKALVDQLGELLSNRELIDLAARAREGAIPDRLAETIAAAVAEGVRAAQVTQTPQPTPDDLLTRQQAAAVLGIHPRTLADRDIPRVREGRAVRYLRRDLMAWAERNRVMPPTLPRPAGKLTSKPQRRRAVDAVDALLRGL